MPGPLLHVGAVATCSHAMGQMMIISSNARVLVSGMPVATVADQGMFAGCAFAPGGKPQPCVRTQWMASAARVLINGMPALTAPGPHLCLSADQIPAGPPVIASCQTRVIGQ
ncbi:DUF4280 domain-containing protein [Ancylobacter sp. 6x-1]|uniref:DUF4280 domain-containing protein n=1 Tax=Ancylobacter crimeensis TaxID=2579147 RepID=A0ABT0D5Z2_9HYPH|nr:PAAR-like protein [Ancylobacter crimeensis]MCK0195352.1 DUF4280 domain-containing protein [Ancylobacter crimeensis]